MTEVYQTAKASFIFVFVADLFLFSMWATFRFIAFTSNEVLPEIALPLVFKGGNCQIAPAPLDNISRGQETLPALNVWVAVRSHTSISLIQGGCRYICS